MAVEWMENFQNYGTTAQDGLANMVDGMWAEVAAGAYAALVADPDGVSPGLVFEIDKDSPGPSSGQTAGDVARRVLPSGTQTTVGIAYRIWFNELPSEAGVYRPKMSFRNSDNESQVTIVVETTGAISAYSSSPSPDVSSTLLGTTTGPVITAASWNHVEVKVVAGAAVGSVEIRVNGIPVLALENVNTEPASPTGIAQIVWGHLSMLETNWKMYLKDIIVWNASGTENNDFMGDVQVVTLRPDGDSSFNWTPSIGATGFDLIDELNPDDADYISAADPPPAASVFTLDDLDPDIVTVKALMPVSRMWKTDGGTANVQMTLTTNAANDAGADRPITVAATYWFDISELSPSTGVSWTPTEVNNALFSIDRTL